MAVVIVLAVVVVGYFVLRYIFFIPGHPLPQGGIASFEPDPHRDIVLVGSNTIGGHLAVPLLEAFAQSAGSQRLAKAQWRAPQSLQDRSRVALQQSGLAADKLALCVLNAKPEQQFAVEGGPERLIDIAPGSGCGAPMLQAGLANIAMLSRPIKDDEKQRYASLGPWTDEDEAFGAPSRREHVIAMDGIAIIANPATRPESLTKDQLYRIFSMASDAMNWSAFNGPDQKIALFSRDEVSGTYDTFKSLVMHDSGLVFSSNGQPGAHRLDSTQALVDAVRRTPGAIGYVGLEYASEHPDMVVPIAECGLKYTPVGAGADWMIKTEDYPLARRLFLYTPEHVRLLTPTIQTFINFVNSPIGQSVVAKANYVSLERDLFIRKRIRRF